MPSKSKMATRGRCEHLLKKSFFLFEQLFQEKHKTTEKRTKRNKVNYNEVNPHLFLGCFVVAVVVVYIVVVVLFCCCLGFAVVNKSLSDTP